MFELFIDITDVLSIIYYFTMYYPAENLNKYLWLGYQIFVPHLLFKHTT